MRIKEGNERMLAEILTNIIRYQIYPFSVFLSVILCIALSNMLLMPRLKDSGANPKGALSILVPARNEEVNIEKCVLSLLGQNHPDFEVIVLDDNSTDRTSEILRRIADTHPRLKLMKGNELPPGWTGKNWACWQLAQASTGDFLLFTDADTYHASDSASAACQAISSEGAGLVSGLVRQKMLTLGELITVPVMNWAMICFMPLILAGKKRARMLTAACGQFMAFTRASYFGCGGHQAIKGEVLDDAELASLMKSSGMGSLLFDATDHVSCRMYRGFKEAVEGFTKNLFGVFRNRILLFSFIWSWLLLTMIAPFAYLFLLPEGSDPQFAVMALVSVGITLMIWLVAFVKARVPIYLAFFFPVILPLWFWLAMRSMYRVLTGKATWKGRGIGSRRIKLF